MNPMMATHFAGPDDQKTNWTVGFCDAQANGMLTYAEALLGENDYFAAGALTLADIALATALGMWDGALGKAIPPRLAAHRERMMQRPAYQKARAAFSAAI
jgi:glutathione S-transferase